MFRRYRAVLWFSPTLGNSIGSTTAYTMSDDQVTEQEKKVATDKADGLPNMPQKRAMPIVPVVFTCMTLALGVGIAYAIVKNGSGSTYSKRIAEIVAAEQHWAYAAAALIAATVRWLNIYPSIHKSQIMGMRGSESIGPNLRSNPFIYKAVGEGAAPNAVIFENSGPTGSYNRANRSLHHMVENMASVLVSLALSGHLFPFPSFVCVAVWCAGRLLHQVGYTYGYGGHGLGFAISMLAQVSLEGLVALVALVGWGFLALDPTNTLTESTGDVLAAKPADAFVSAAAEALGAK